MGKFKQISTLILFLFILMFSCNVFTFETLDTQINGIKLHVEIAATHEERLLGLMHRKKLPENEGMLFIYPSERIIKLWMKNTSKDLALYAVEVNQGWFQINKVSVGDTFKFSEVKVD